MTCLDTTNMSAENKNVIFKSLQQHKHVTENQILNCEEEIKTNQELLKKLINELHNTEEQLMILSDYKEDFLKVCGYFKYTAQCQDFIRRDPYNFPPSEYQTSSVIFIKQWNHLRKNLTNQKATYEIDEKFIQFLKKYIKVMLRLLEK
jgi:hypothetical protein